MNPLLEKAKVQMHYGLSITHPSIMVKFVEPPPPTLWELAQCALYKFWSIAVPSFYLAVSITAFRWAFGGFG